MSSARQFGRKDALRPAMTRQPRLASNSPTHTTTNRPAQVASHQASDEDPSVGLSPIALVASGGGILLLAAALLVWALAPITYRASRTSYSQIEIREMLSVSASSRLLDHKVVAQHDQKYGIDVSRIMLPAERETTRAMQQVAEQCIPMKLGAKSPMLVMPVKAHAAFGVITEYLVCAMRVNKDRLCDPSERRRLVEQLVAFKDKRQSVLAWERGRDALLATPMFQFGAKMKEMSDGQSLALPILGDVLDERITSGIANLNREGLLTAADFSFMGLFLPEEYALALATSERGAARCS
jgi:hypothetical protein